MEKKPYETPVWHEKHLSEQGVIRTSPTSGNTQEETERWGPLQ